MRDNDANATRLEWSRRTGGAPAGARPIARRFNDRRPGVIIVARISPRSANELARPTAVA